MRYLMREHWFGTKPLPCWPSLWARCAPFQLSDTPSPVGPFKQIQSQLYSEPKLTALFIWKLDFVIIYTSKNMVLRENICILYCIFYCILWVIDYVFSSPYKVWLPHLLLKAQLLFPELWLQYILFRSRRKSRDFDVFFWEHRQKHNKNLKCQLYTEINYYISSSRKCTDMQLKKIYIATSSSSATLICSSFFRLCSLASSTKCNVLLA